MCITCNLLSLPAIDAVFPASWATFYSFLYAIYYDDVSFSGSQAYIFVYADRQGVQIPRQTNLLAQTAMSRPNLPPFCSAHAFYRLADRYF